MSLSKELCLRSDSQNRQSFSDRQNNHSLNERKEDNYKRDSFDDRFCDDLSEVILQYLSLEDKLRLECVSKQFQRTVFQRQYELYISRHLSPEVHKHYLKNRHLFPIRSVLNYYYIEDQSLHSFKALLKKCPNITSIQLDGYQLFDPHHNHDKINEVYRLIIKNCNNLSEINLLEDLNDSNFEEFHQKFGQNIKYLPYFDGKLIEMNRFPNIEKVIITYVENELIISQLKLEKLKQLDIVFNPGQEHMLQTVIDTFPSLTHLKVSITDQKNAIYNSLKNISNLKHLIHFGFHNGFGKNDNRFCDLLKQMANNCQKLKSIDCRLNFETNSNIKQLLSQLKVFSALKRLNLWFIFKENEDYDVIDGPKKQLFSFELFKGFSNITHLALNFGQIFVEFHFKEIDINLPKLQYLEINNYFHKTREGVKEMADILSRLSRLETLKLKLEFGVDFKPIEEQITEKCRKIRKILIECKSEPKYIDSKQCGNFYSMIPLFID